MPAPRALVTGATGLLGSHIVERLAADGWSLRALVRSPAAELPVVDIERAVGDVLDADAFARAARGCDVIFHAAAAVTPRGGWEAFRRPNVDGTSNAIAAAEGAGAKLLHVSSVAVYGPQGRFRTDGRPTDENTPFAPLPERAFYARSKRESEELVLEAHARGRIWASAVRPTVIYGPRDRQFVPRVARLLSHGVAAVVGGGHTTLSIVQAANVADGAVRAAMSAGAGGQAYILANDGDVTVRRFIELASAGLGRGVRVVSIPGWLATGGFSVVRWVAKRATAGRSNLVSNASIALLTKDNPFVSHRARRELGWTAVVRPDEGIPDAFRWWAAHPMSIS